MLIMSAHEMLNVNATVTGTVDGDSYDPQYLCDNDPHQPIRTTGTSMSFAVTGAAALTGINGLVVSHHNLVAALSVTFSGLGAVTTLTVPPNGIRLNPYTVLGTPAGSVSSTTVATSGNDVACIVGEVFAGIFRTVRTLPVGTGFGFRGFGTPHPGEFGGMAYAKGGESRNFGGSVYLNDASKAILDNAWRASEENSLPTVIVPYATSPDAWVVTWENYEPVAVHPNIWRVGVMWEEVSRLRWPA